MTERQDRARRELEGANDHWSRVFNRFQGGDAEPEELAIAGSALARATDELYYSYGQTAPQVDKLRAGT